MIPEPLKNFNCEVIGQNGLPYLIKIELIPFEDWSHTIKGKFEDKLATDRKATIALDLMGITEKDDQIKQYAYCKNGGFDNLPDFTGDNIHTAEYFNCPKRSTCPANIQKLMCGCFVAPNGILNPREIEVLKLVADNMPEKLIADQLNTSINTVKTQTRAIREKIGTDDQKGVVRFAVEKGIIN